MKAIALISGGLDSALAARLIKDEKIEVIGLYFQIPFSAGDTKRANKQRQDTKKVLSNLGIEVKNVDIKADFLELIKNPRYGFGSHMNPCIDCKIFMLRKAKEMMPQLQAEFIVTGEVLGQRPMSQNKQALELIVKRAGLEGFLLRPLSAKLLPETIPEKEGWVKRENLFDFSGRSRQPQIALAKRLKIKDYQQPAGGCLLADPQFAKRIKDLVGCGELNLDNVELLKIGRHFRLSPKAKLMVGRDEEENNELAKSAKEDDYLFRPKDIAGATALGRGIFNNELIRLSCSITCRYCDLNGSVSTDIFYKRPFEKKDETLNASAISKTELEALRI